MRGERASAGWGTAGYTTMEPQVLCGGRWAGTPPAGPPPGGKRCCWLAGAGPALDRDWAAGRTAPAAVRAGFVPWGCEALPEQ